MNLSLSEIQQIIGNEMTWCEEYPMDGMSEDYVNGFICGLRQALDLLQKAALKINQE